MDEMRAETLRKARDLRKKNMIALPLQTWDGKFPNEQKALARSGFIFCAYSVDKWFFEVVEMLRKFLLTTTIVFLFPNSTGQVVSAFLITFFFFMLTAVYRPFCTEDLNNLQLSSLLVQALTLFAGILLSIEGFIDREAKLSGTEDREPQSRRHRILIEFFVFIINLFTLGWPLLHLAWTGVFSQLFQRTMQVFTYLQSLCKHEEASQGVCLHGAAVVDSPKLTVQNAEAEQNIEDTHTEETSSPMTILQIHSQEEVGLSARGRNSLYWLSRASSGSLSMLVAQQSCEDEDLSDSDPDQDQSQSKARNSIDSDDVIPELGGGMVEELGLPHEMTEQSVSVEPGIPIFDNARINLQPRCVDDQDIRQVSQGACLEAGDLLQQNPRGWQVSLPGICCTSPRTTACGPSLEIVQSPPLPVCSPFRFGSYHAHAAARRHAWADMHRPAEEHSKRQWTWENDVSDVNPLDLIPVTVPRAPDAPAI
jgi:hypothetical protein